MPRKLDPSLKRLLVIFALFFVAFVATFIFAAREGSRPKPSPPPPLQAAPPPRP
ncbi:MAG: hypothetical protein KA712_17610 [Myxococcales bacterium]|nr:hypothetical protein [Myxococcales bacterium]